MEMSEPASFKTKNGIKGLVLSDLHLFAARSRGWNLLEKLHDGFSTLDLLVFNGDIFDFRWSTLPTQEATIKAGIAWLNKLITLNPHCRIHYLLGNHDCLDAFQHQLKQFSARHPQFQCHEYFLRLGNSVFLHGDCVNRRMSPDDLADYRAQWKKGDHFGPALALLYKWIDRLGITRMIHHSVFCRPEVAARITFYLDQANPGWRKGTRHCYFGHTHLPFTGFEHEGILFHNTGSACGNLGFLPIFFDSENPSSKVEGNEHKSFGTPVFQD